MRSLLGIPVRRRDDFVAFLLNIGPEAGWFSYVPLAGPQYRRRQAQDFWAQLITFTELSA